MNESRIVALDLIRFFAALSVVFYHYTTSSAYPLFNEVAKYGYLGVPLFFIISGYVIALSANNRSPVPFAISRFVRLYPALWAGVIFTVVILMVFSDKQYSILQILANFTLINEYLGVEDIDGVYWTLKIELKFYACTFLLLFFGFFHKYHIWLSLWLALAVIYTFWEQPFFMGWFISPEYSSFFIAGIAFFLIQNYGRSIFCFFILILSLVLASYGAVGQVGGFIKGAGVVEEVVSVAIIWFFYGVMYLLSTGKIQLKARGLYLTLGALTYPLYLIHNMAGKAIINSYSGVIPEKILIMMVVMLMVFIAWLIHLLVERPLATPMKSYMLSIFDRIRLR